MQRKIIVAIILNVLVVSFSLGIIGYLAVNESIDRAMKTRLTLATILAKDIDMLLERNLSRLYDISLSGSINLKDGDWEPEKRALRNAYQYSLFTDGVFLLDKLGNVLLTYPPKLEEPTNFMSVPYVSRVIDDGRPVISDIYTVEPTKKKIIYAMVPLKDSNGDVVGVAGGEIDPPNFRFGEIIKSVPADRHTYLEIIDSHGIVISSNNPVRVFTGNDHDRFLERLISQKKATIKTCHRCHSDSVQNGGTVPERSTDLMAFAPLEMAHWGVSIVEPEKEIFAPADKLKKTFVVFIIASFTVALIIGIGMSRSIVKPVHELIDATHKIASGDMTKTIGFGGKDEIGMLSSSFEVMRVKLADSLESLLRSNLELEQRVMDRTRQIRESQKKVEDLLKMVISVQEDERKRIARGLHDQTMQTLSALLMRINMHALYPETISAFKIDEMRQIVLTTLDDLYVIIQNLRPAVLDDLGLEAAIRWLVEQNFAEKGIATSFDIVGPGTKRLESKIEIALFRIIQEAVINIARHSDAENVFIVLHYGDAFVGVDIEDDGQGFDVSSAIKRSEDWRGLGLMGMKERANLLDGSLEICSQIGFGTRIGVMIPTGQDGQQNAAN